MFHLMASLLWTLIAFRWGDWRNWEKYQATILYLITCDLLYNFLTYNYPLWQYSPTLLLPNHTLINILVMFVIYTCSVLVYLPHYPKGWKQVPYVLLWVSIWLAIERLLLAIHLMTYQHNWIFWYSVLFDILAFSMLRLHHKKPLLTYVLSVFIVIFLMVAFHVPVTKMK